MARLLCEVANDAVAPSLVDLDKALDRRFDVTRLGFAIHRHRGYEILDEALEQPLLAAIATDHGPHVDAGASGHLVERHLVEPLLAHALAKGLKDLSGRRLGSLGAGGLAIGTHRGWKVAARFHVAYIDIKSLRPQVSCHLAWREMGTEHDLSQRGIRSVLGNAVMSPLAGFPTGPA